MIIYVSEIYSGLLYTSATCTLRSRAKNVSKDA
jgi:hypothetical protein